MSDSSIVYDSEIEPPPAKPVEEHSVSSSSEGDLGEITPELVTRKKVKNQTFFDKLLDSVRVRAKRIWAYLKPVLIRIFTRLWNEVTCYRRKRKQHLQANSWVLKKLADRSERQVVIETKTKTIYEKQHAEWYALVRDRKMSRRRRLLKSWQLAFRYCCNSCRSSTQELCCKIHNQSGLPSHLLEWFQFEELVSEGIHGYVFRALDVRNNPVAVKIRDKSRGVMLRMPFRRSLRTLRRYVVVPYFVRLARLLSFVGVGRRRFHHDNIVTFYGVHETAEFYVEVTEWVGGGSLQTHLDTHHFVDEVSACKIFSHILIAIQYLHSHHLIHRDIRLCQFLLPLDEKNFPSLDSVKLSDGWLMIRMPKGSRWRYPVVDERVTGDVLTRAPEVLKFGEWSAKSDIWSAGCVLCELLFGHGPYGGERTALAERICKNAPEIDRLVGDVSAGARDLLKQLLAREAAHRPTAKIALDHQWFRDFADEQTKGVHHTEDWRIKEIYVYGQPPPCRRGMDAENLLKATHGMFNAGFCTFMGSCRVDLVFMVGHEKHYWVRNILVSLWANGDNPQKIMLYGSSRPGAWALISDNTVAGPRQREVRMEVEQPIRYVKMALGGNFGGDYGIAIRKISFYGYPICPVPVTMPVDDCVFFRGSACYVHDDQYKDDDYRRAHPFCRNFFEKGSRIPGTAQRYYCYRDIESGPIHASTVASVSVQLDPGHTITAAALSLRFASISSESDTLPRLRIVVETYDSQREVVFQTPDLEPFGDRVDDIPFVGYQNIPTLFAQHLHIDTDYAFMVEVCFENNGGYLHIPADLGLCFYYVPELHTPTEEPEADELAAAGEGRFSMLLRREQDGGGGPPVDGEFGMAGDMEGDANRKRDVEYERMVEEHREEELEKALHTDMQHLQRVANFGLYGADKFRVRDLRPWNPNEEEGLITDVTWCDRASEEEVTEALVEEFESIEGVKPSKPLSRRVAETKGFTSRKSRKKSEAGEDDSTSSDDSYMTPTTRASILVARNTLTAQAQKVDHDELTDERNRPLYEDRALVNQLANEHYEQLKSNLNEVAANKERARHASRTAEFLRLKPWLIDAPENEVKEEMDRYEIRYHSRKQVFVPTGEDSGLFRNCLAEPCHAARGGCRQAKNYMNESFLSLPIFTPPVPPSSPRDSTSRQV